MNILSSLRFTFHYLVPYYHEMFSNVWWTFCVGGTGIVSIRFYAATNCGWQYSRSMLWTNTMWVVLKWCRKPQPHFWTFQWPSICRVCVVTKPWNISRHLRVARISPLWLAVTSAYSHKCVVTATEMSRCRSRYSQVYLNGNKGNPKVECTLSRLQPVLWLRQSHTLVFIHRWKKKRDGTELVAGFFWYDAMESPTIAHILTTYIHTHTYYMTKRERSKGKVKTNK